MGGEIFRHPRLAAIYDALEGKRGDLDAYLVLAAEFGARRVLDIGCGTGVFALRLADRGIEVVGVDPAGASIEVAKTKPGSDRVHWLHGDATDLPPLQVDLATMTANVAQQIVSPDVWHQTLTGAREALRPGGFLVFETRDPARPVWDEEWDPAFPPKFIALPDGDTVETWGGVIEMDLPLVTFRWNYRFASDGEHLTSDSTLRFRAREEVEADLTAHGYRLHEVRAAPDRPGKEFVFLAQRP